MRLNLQSTVSYPCMFYSQYRNCWELGPVATHDFCYKSVIFSCGFYLQGATSIAGLTFGTNRGGIGKSCMSTAKVSVAFRYSKSGILCVLSS